ncbi:hypothetical protein EYF80_016575 [Liparis tanakae]|uniref:Uncharacterized protein n=1 Tax=Liparis tanakae TaxID=230148 RepID=A0A4Z2I7E0_9TELE|nr:hypothetical protein EYF80_016575 [Liparis tanakae]
MEQLSEPAVLLARQMNFPDMLLCQRTEFLEMSELGLYQACNTTIWPLTTSISPLGISTSLVMRCACVTDEILGDSPYPTSVRSGFLLLLSFKTKAQH